MTRLAVLGATASGKSALALEVAEVAQAHGIAVEVVAIDAFTVYRGLDIGTAKPSQDVRRRVPHHMVDVLDPDETLTVAQFQRLAQDAIEQVRERGHIPLLVGGSGLYWRAVVDDLRFPPTDDEVRRALHERFAEDPLAAYQHLRSIDPAAAERIDPSNLRRTVRALEVYELTGERFSSFSTDWEAHEQHPDLTVVYLEFEPAMLRERIAERARHMVAAGLVEEAAALRERGRLSRTAAQAIGYAEAFAVLDGTLTYDELAEAISIRTWRYAKRQRSWFSRDPRAVAMSVATARATLLSALGIEGSKKPS